MIDVADARAVPLDDDTLKLYQNSVPAPRATYVFYPAMTRLDRLSAPDIYSYDSRWTAHLKLSDRRANGVILAAGDSSCGYELILRKGYAELIYVYTRHEVFTIRSDRRLPAGEHQLTVELRKTAEDAAAVTLSIDGEAIGGGELPRMWPIYAPESGLRCGENRHAPISFAYQPPFALSGQLERVVIDVDLPAA